MSHRRVSSRHVSLHAPLLRGTVTDASELGDKAARINSTLPQRILPAINANALKQGETRSRFLARAALDAMRKPE